MMVASEADEAWCPPTFTPSMFSRTWLAWWMVQVASHSTFRSSSRRIASSRALGFVSGAAVIASAIYSALRRSEMRRAAALAGLLRQQHLTAGGGQIGHPGSRPRLCRRTGFGVQHRLGEPVIELRAAAIVRRPRLLRRALGTVGGADDPHVEVIVVPPPRLDLVQPMAVAAGVAAQRLLDRGIDEDAGDLRVLRRGPDQRHVRRRPYLRVDVPAVFGHDHGRRYFFPLLARQLAVGHWREPNVGVEAHLMAGMAGEHRAAARLPHVTDEETVPAGLGRLRREPLEERNQVRMAPIAVARESHDLPGRAVDRQRRRAGVTALGIKADGARLQIRGRGLAAEQ